MKVLYIASEARPFIASGGLADVAGSLPLSLKRKGVDCRVVIPLYSKISEPLLKQVHFITKFESPVSWRRRYCGVFQAEHEGVIYYFIDNEYYFKRPTLYDEYDNGERFAFFSRAVLEMLPYIDFWPDVINANDWQTALVPIYHNIYYSKDERYSGIKTVFTIHNIAFQGKYGFDLYNDTLGLPDSAIGLIEYDRCVNLMKGAIQAANSIVTVSPSYANEISGRHNDTSGYDFGQGLTPFIAAESHKLIGILNGVDTSSMNPRLDANLYRRYDARDFKTGKAANKLWLRERLGLQQNADVPLIGIVTRIDPEQKGCQLILEALGDGLLDRNEAQFVILGSAADSDFEGKQLENDFRNVESRYRGRAVAYIGFVPELAQKIYAASDIYLMPSKYEPCGLSQIIAMKYGAIPVVRETGGLSDTVRDSLGGDGNGFTFKNYSSRELSDAIERALAGFKIKSGWYILTRRAMKCDFSWDSGSANEYIALFERLVG